MISQTRDVAATPAGEDMYTVLHNYTAAQLASFLHDEMVHMVGSSVGILLTGIALTVGISSILLLSSKRTLSKQDNFFRAFTIVLLALAIAFQTQGLRNTFLPFISLSYSLDKMNEDITRSTIAIDVTLAVIAGLTDGLLVWRCFMVQKALGNNSSKWGNTFWIFPALIWLTTIAMVITASIMISESSMTWFVVASASGCIGNILLNLYATLFISIRLLFHRQLIIANQGNSALTTQHIYIIGIFLESATINLPVMTVCAIGIGMVKVEILNSLLLIVVPNQVLASVLIIHQVALGRILCRQRESKVDRLIEIAKHGTPRASESSV